MNTENDSSLPSPAQAAPGAETVPPLSNIRVVLVNGIYGGNIGSACRAMANMGLSDLWLVNPRDSVDWEEAAKMACHAGSILQTRHVVPVLADAVADCALVAGVTARTGLYRDHAKTPREWAPRLLEAASAAPVALVFGSEDNGLSREEIALCTQLVRIPSSPAYASLNLAQAVLVVAYELFVRAGDFAPPEESSPEAPSRMREAFFAKYDQALFDIGFTMPETRSHMMLGVRRIFSRGPLTEKDLQILLGIASQTQWAANELKKLRPPRA
jgi:TrmH family RNA methyltransferase